MVSSSHSESLVLVITLAWWHPRLARLAFGTYTSLISLLDLQSDNIFRGQYYGIAAAVGKIGAFAGSYALDAIQKAAGDDEIAAGRNPFFVASSLAFVAAALVLLLPHIGQDTIDEEDAKFRDYLMANGYDTSKMGLQSTGSTGVDSDENVPVPVEHTYAK